MNDLQYSFPINNVVYFDFINITKSMFFVRSIGPAPAGMVLTRLKIRFGMGRYRGEKDSQKER